MDYDKYDNQENQEVRRKRRRSRRHKNSGCAGTMVYVIAVVGASLVISLAAIFTANDVFAFVKDNAMQQFYVSENTKLADLAKDLDKQGIINYGTVFKAYLAVKGDSADDVLAGEYQLNPSMDYGQIIDKLTNSSSSDTLQITIPEGYSVAQVRQLLLDNHVCTADALDKVLNQYPFKHDFLQDEKPVEEGWLEGYLFPDTYEIYKGNGSVVDTVNKMLNNFASRYDSEITDGANELGRSMHDIVTVASLVEREAQHDDERARIAGVIYNRLNNSSEFPYLQGDASVLYGLGRSTRISRAIPRTTFIPRKACLPDRSAIRAMPRFTLQATRRAMIITIMSQCPTAATCSQAAMRSISATLRPRTLHRHRPQAKTRTKARR